MRWTTPPIWTGRHSRPRVTTCEVETPMEYIELKEIDNMTRTQLKLAIKGCFEYAPEANPVDRLAVLQEAQFYSRELESRRDSWVSIRDFILEIVVIGLIGWEIHMNYRAERLQSQNFEKEQAVFTNLQASSAGTASTLITLQETSKQMNEAVQKELAVAYEVSLNVKYDITSDRIIITNEGRTSVALWGSKVGKSGIVMEKTARTLTPGVPYSIPGPEVSAGLSGVLPPGGFRPVPFVMFVKNERGEEFVARYEFVALTRVGPLQIQPIMVSITQFKWSKKH